MSKIEGGNLSLNITFQPAAKAGFDEATSGSAAVQGADPSGRGGFDAKGAREEIFQLADKLGIDRSELESGGNEAADEDGAPGECPSHRGDKAQKAGQGPDGADGESEGKGAQGAGMNNRQLIIALLKAMLAAIDNAEEEDAKKGDGQAQKGEAVQAKTTA